MQVYFWDERQMPMAVEHYILEQLSIFNNLILDIIIHLYTLIWGP